MPTIEENTQLLRQAARQGDQDEVRRLIPMSEPKNNNSLVLRETAEYGHTQCVELLIPVSNPKDNNSYALRTAARYGHTKCVELLIPVSDPKALDSAALYWAVYHGHTSCVDLLYPVSEPVVALKELQEQYPNEYSKWGQLQQMVEVEKAERLNKVLHQEIGDTTSPKVQRKM